MAAVTKASRPGHLLHLFRAVHSSEERSLFDRRVYCNFRRARSRWSLPPVALMEKLSLPTHEGLQFPSDAPLVLAHWNSAIEGVQEGPLRGPIKITAPLEFGREELAPIADRFQLLHPSTQIMLHLADDVIELVEQNIDVALHFGPLSDSTLRARLLLRAKRVVCAAPSYRETRGIPERPEDLSQHNCLVQARPDATFATWTFQVDGKLTSVRVRGDRIANESESLRNWATAGRGILRRAAFGIRKELSSGDLVTALDAFSISSNLYAVTSAGILS